MQIDSPLLMRKRLLDLIICWGLSFLLPSGCTSGPAGADPACQLLQAPAPGPLAKEREREDDPIEIGRIFIREAHRTGDAGFYALAGMAADCARSRGEDAVELQRLDARLAYEAHRFSEAEARARVLSEKERGIEDYALLGDALHEQGRLEEAAAAYQVAADREGSLPLYGRIGQLRWSWGDGPGAIEMFELALQSPGSEDREARAWALAQLGWMRALHGQSAPELDQAIELVPDSSLARLYRGRFRLHMGDRAGAAEDLRQAGHSFEALWALSEVDPLVSPERVCPVDPRTCSTWIADREPVRALALLDEELHVRKDAATRIARAYAAFRAGQDAREEILSALETGTRDPRSLLLAGLVLDDAGVIRQATQSGPGLLPSEHAKASTALQRR